MAARYPITLLLRLAETIKLPETHLGELKLLVDDNLEGVDWTLNAVNGITVDNPGSWKGLDKLIRGFLQAHDDTGVDFMMAPSDTEIDSEDLAEFALKMFPVATRNNRFRFLGLQFRSCEFDCCPRISLSDACVDAVNELFSTSAYAEDTFEELTADIVLLEEGQET